MMDLSGRCIRNGRFPDAGCLWFRMRGMLAVVAVDRVEVYNQPTPGCVTPVAGEAARRWAITFLAAAMSAPPTGT